MLACGLDVPSVALPFKNRSCAGNSDVGSFRLYVPTLAVPLIIGDWKQSLEMMLITRIQNSCGSEDSKQSFMAFVQLWFNLPSQ